MNRFESEGRWEMRWFREKNVGDRYLVDRLKSYPAYGAPHTGEDIAFGSYRNVESPVFAQLDDIRRATSDAISGAYEAFWLAEARKAVERGST
jgi:hypothetical protein